MISKSWSLSLEKRLSVTKEEARAFTCIVEGKGIKQFNTVIISGLRSLIKISFDRSLILLPLA